MNLRLRTWMPVAAVMLVLLSIATLLLYVLPAASSRLSGYAEDRALGRAAAVASGVAQSERGDLPRELEHVISAEEEEVLLVDRQGNVETRAGVRILPSPPPQEILQRAAEGQRFNDMVGEQSLAVVPLVREGNLDGGVVFVPADSEATLYQLFLRSGMEAAAIASIVGGGLALLLAVLLSRRIERLTFGARSIERGNLSYRIENTRFNDELGELGVTFNSMAAKLQDSFAHLEHRVAERTAELEAERARLEAVLRQMPSGVTIAEAPSGKILLSNERAQQIRHRSLPQAVGVEEYDRFVGFHPDGRPYEPQEWPLARTIGKGEEVVGEEIVIPRSGKAQGTILINSSPIYDRDGRVVAGVAIFSDITEEKQAEEEIRQLNEELEQRVRERTSQLEQERATLNAILDNLAEGVLAADSRDRAVFVNPAARSMLNVDGDRILKKLPSPWKDFDLPGTVARCMEERECIEARVRDGNSFLQVTLEYLPTFDEHRGGVLVVVQDLSEGRRLEANQQRFLANAAHELKTPITTILGASELLLTESEDDPEIRHRFLNHIFSEARRMQQLSETLLRLARTGVDLRDPEAEVLDLDGVAREAVARMGPLAKAAGIDLRVDGRGGRVLVDHQWLEQVLLVVLGNSVQHSEHGDGIWVRVAGGAVTVEDEGSGISEADLPYVFERFFRGKRSSGGFGLGLAICKDLVERMGGSISLHSKEGVGTRVEIELPEVGESAEDSDS